MMADRERVVLFLSYAQKDESLLRKLEIHLSLLKRQGLISVWHNRKIVPGMDWDEEIGERLEQASIILLLVSSDFLASDYCYQIEMRRALERHQTGQAQVIPIAMRPADWSGAPFAGLQALPTNAKAITSWRNRDEAFVDVVAGIRRTIEDLPFLSASIPRAALPAIWNIPYPRNSFFLGRDDLLSHLHDRLQTRQAMALSQSPQAITGLGGIGKTQIAIEYAYRYHQEYEAVLWAQAESLETLNASYSAIATLLRLSQRDAKKQEMITEAVKMWLQTHRKWLFILDNGDDLSLLPPFLPPSMGGHLLLTTRAQAMGRLAQRLEVEPLPLEQGVLFLLRRASLIAPDASLEQASLDDCQSARVITQELGGLPLALDQVGAYLEGTRSGPSEYRKIYRQRRAQLLSGRGGVISDHPEPVATTWSLSFERVEQQYPAAADLLRLCAYLSPDAIPEEIMTEGALDLGPQLSPVVADRFLFGQAIETLRASSLLSRDPQSHQLSVHRLVQVVLVDQMDESSRRQWAERTVHAVSATFPEEIDHPAWPQCDRLLPHALRCASLIEDYQLTFPRAAWLLNQTGLYLKARARYQEAEPLVMRALSISEQQLGASHPDTARSLNLLANLYQDQGKYEEAEPLYVRALSIREQQLGASHPDTALTLNHLASLYRTQGKYAQAEPLVKRALAIYEQELGLQHPDTAMSLNNLAGLCYQQGKYEEAEPLYVRALSIREQQLGASHPDTARSLNNLAELYRDQGKYAQAEPLYIRALSIREQQLGTEHPITATSLNNLANLYRMQGNYAQAEPLYVRALAIQEQHLEARHPHKARSLTYLAELYRDQGKYEEAEPLYVRALSIREQQLGASHPHTARSLNNLANLYRMQGKYDQAEPLYVRALSILEHALGREHASTRSVCENYASLLQELGRDTEARQLEEDA